MRNLANAEITKKYVDEIESSSASTSTRLQYICHFLKKCALQCNVGVKFSARPDLKCKHVRLLTKPCILIRIQLDANKCTICGYFISKWIKIKFRVNFFGSKLSFVKITLHKSTFTS